MLSDISMMLFRNYQFGIQPKKVIVLEFFLVNNYTAFKIFTYNIIFVVSFGNLTVLSIKHFLSL